MLAGAHAGELPIELVREILILAALDHVDQHAAWVATLLRISRPIYSLIHPILVHTVVASDIDKLCAASAHPHLVSSTRNLVIGPQAESTAVAIDSLRLRLARAFHAVEGFCGPKHVFAMLALYSSFQPRIVVLSPSTQTVDNFFKDVVPALQRATHVHAHVSIRYHSHLDLPDLSALQLTHLILDVIYFFFEMPLLGTIRLLLSIRSIRLLVVRCPSLTETIAPDTFQFWRERQSQGDHRLQLEHELSHDICLEMGSRVFDRSLWTPSMSSFPGAAWQE